MASQVPPQKPVAPAANPQDVLSAEEWKELGELMSKVTTIVGHRFSQALGEADPAPPGNA